MTGIAYKVSPEIGQQTLEALAKYGSVRAAAQALGIARCTMQRRLRGLGVDIPTSDMRQEPAEEAPQPVIKGRLKTVERQTWPVPTEGVARYIFTCAQSNTLLHEPLWANLEALAAHYGASLHVATFTYDLASYGPQSVKRGTAKSEPAEPWYDDRVKPHLLDASVLVAPGLVWCGEMNILPTAVRPLSGLESYTGRKSGIFPHAKIALECVPSGKFEGTKFNYTTGTVTTRNYIQKKAGQKAEFHHGYGALLVEVNSKGQWWVRQLNGDSEGTIYDKTLCARDGVVTDGHRVMAINWGDLHEPRLPYQMREVLWGSMGPTLRPRYQFAHDTLDWRARNHHEMKNFHRMYEKHALGQDDVVEELKGAAELLFHDMTLPDCQTIVVRSNHDAAFDTWLRDADYKLDLRNAKFFLKAQVAMLEAIERKDKGFMPFEWAARELYKGDQGNVRFLKRDESFVICEDANGGIECGQHADKGANGMRGTPSGFAKVGRKGNYGDKHTPCIMDGAYFAGVAGDLDHGYNEGMSSWSNSHIVTYENGKRAIYTVWDHQWCAQ